MLRSMTTPYVKAALRVRQLRGAMVGHARLAQRFHPADRLSQMSQSRRG